MTTPLEPTAEGIRVAPSRTVLSLVWVAAVVFFGALLAVAQSTEGPLDDSDPAFQRPGFLDVGNLPQPAPPIADISYLGHRTVVFFERNDRVAALCRALGSETFEDDVQLVIVVGAETATIDCAANVVATSDRELVDRFGIRRPRGGGPPVGYAIVDDDARIRYVTLDPAVASLLDEVRTVVGALS